jgi:hypothetical protein
MTAVHALTKNRIISSAIATKNQRVSRALAQGGLLDIDVLNAACLCNPSTMPRGNHINWDCPEHYVQAQPSIYNQREYYPKRDNRKL